MRKQREKKRIQKFSIHHQAHISIVIKHCFHHVHFYCLNENFETESFSQFTNAQFQHLHCANMYVAASTLQNERLIQ